MYSVNKQNLEQTHLTQYVQKQPQLGPKDTTPGFQADVCNEHCHSYVTLHVILEYLALLIYCCETIVTFVITQLSIPLD